MAPVPVDVAPALRPWRGAGIVSLLLSPDAASLVREKAARKPSRHSAPPPAAAAARSTPFGGAEASGPQTDFKAHPAPPVATPPSVSSASLPPTPQPASAPRIGPEGFSPAWKSLWEQRFAISPQPQTVWTYAELGTDLHGQASAERRTVLQNLIVALHMPKGSHAFWPYCLPPDNTPDLPMFFSGLARFRPVTVLLMGDRAAEAFAACGAMPSGPLQDCLCQGYRFVRLPDMEDIAQMSAPAKNRLIAFIRTSLS